MLPVAAGRLPSEVARNVDPIPELKRQLAAELQVIAKLHRSWDLALLIGTDQPRISDLRKGKLARFSLERLFRFLHSANYEVELRVIRRRSK